MIPYILNWGKVWREQWPEDWLESPHSHKSKCSLRLIAWATVLLKGEAWVVKEVVENHWASVLAVRLGVYYPLLFLLEQAYAFIILPTYIAPKYPPNSPLLLML